MLKHRILIGLGIFLTLLILFVVVELLIIKYNGMPVAAPEIPRTTQTLGSGPGLKFLVMGDSTSIGQGTDYSHSYAYAGAEHLAQHYQVSLLNVGISGARAKDVETKQLSKAESFKPDVVLIGVGANDVTHFTSGASVKASLQTVIDGLKQANPNVKIVVTGSPAMGAVARFPWPVKQLAGWRARYINSVFNELIKHNGLIWAPVAAKTGPAFAADPTLFAADKFHPDTRGYALWIPVVNDALDQAETPDHI